MVESKPWRDTENDWPPLWLARGEGKKILLCDNPEHAARMASGGWHVCQYSRCDRVDQAKAQPLAELREELLSVAKKVENEGHREAAKNPNPDSAKLRFAEAAAIREALSILDRERERDA